MILGRGLRHPTAEEFAVDYAKRLKAIDDAERIGLLSARQVQIAREELSEFKGYPRDVERHRPKPRMPRPRIRRGRAHRDMIEHTLMVKAFGTRRVCPTPEVQAALQRVADQIGEKLTEKHLA